jgi:eukaryotic-like serine/threonine-protein kinase
MSEQHGTPSESADGAAPAGPDGPGSGGLGNAPADATGPIERSNGGRMFAGRYRLLARRGTAADVALFEAIDTFNDRTVAVKVVHPDICARDGFGDRFVGVMQDVARTRHPNITEVFDVGSSTWSGRTVYFVVCENLTGGSLRDLRDRGRQLSPSQVVMIGLDACRGLDVAHRSGLVHGDIRPANLLFGSDGRLRLADVGLARLVSDAWWVEPAGVNIEKAKFASPEQAMGLEPTTKSDVYALCLCLLEAVTGQLPFVGDSSVATLSNRVDKLMPVSADLGPLAAVLERAGRPDQADRYSAAEFGRALHLAAEKLPRPAPLALLGGGLFASAPGTIDSTAPTGQTRPSDLAGADQIGGITAAMPTPVVGESEADSESSAPASSTAGATPPPPSASAGSDAARLVTPVFDQVPPGGEPTVSDLVIAPLDVVPVPQDRTEPASAGDSGGPVAPAAPVEPAAPVGPYLPSRDGPAGSAGAPLVPPPPPPPDVTPVLKERRARRKLFAVLGVLVVAAAIGGALAVWFTRTITHDVPDLSSFEQGEALNMVSEFHWNVITTQEPDDEVVAGVVIRTDPVAGTALDEGEDLTLVVSSGPAPRELPEIAGLPVDEATAQLLDLDLVLEIGERVFDDATPPDEVISWQVPDQPALKAGDTVVPGTAIVVTVSNGPQPRSVPDLTGVPLADATSTIEGLGLVLEVLPDEFSPSVPAGSVARQDPETGTELLPGGTVAVAISKGPDLVAIPALAELDLQEATAALEAAGLAVGAVKGDPAGVNVLAEVDGTAIGAGATFPRGTAIDLTFAVPAPPPTEVPPSTDPPTG